MRHSAGLGDLFEHRLFFDAILSDGHAFGAGRHNALRTQSDHGRSRDVLKFGGDGSTTLHQLSKRRLIVGCSLDVIVRHSACRADRVLIEHGGVVAHTLGGLNKHTPELAAT